MPIRTSLFSLGLALSALFVAPAHGKEIVTGQAGGALGDLVVHGHLAYSAQGASVTVWRLAADGASAPVSVARTPPLPGLARGVAIAGDHLFVAWRSPGPTGAVEIYSLADPELPTPVGRFHYTDGKMASPGGLVADGATLHLFDDQLGLFTIDVDEPLAPAVTSTIPDVTGLQRGAVQGDVLVGWGRTLLGGMSASFFDLANPRSPVVVGSYSTWGNFVDAAVGDGLLILTGDGVEIVDFEDPAQPTWQSVLKTGTFLRGAAIVGDHAYVGDSSGFRVWNLADPSAPVEAGRVNAPADRSERFARHATALGGELLVLGESGHGFVVRPGTPDPTVPYRFDLPVGGDSLSVLESDGELLIADFYSGLRVADGGLASVGRYDTGIDIGAHEDVDREGDVAYLASWSYGLLTIDVADPTAPRRLGSVEFPFATAVDAEGDRAYVVSSTGGGVFATYDVSDPTDPRFEGGIAITKGRDVLVHEGLVLIADERVFDIGGLWIVDASVPAAPQVVGRYTDCDSAGGVAAKGNLVALSCHDASLHLVDISVPSAPVQVSTWSDPRVFQTDSVAIDGNVALLGHTSGVEVVAFDVPTAPRRVTGATLAFPARRVAPASDGGFWIAGGMAGVYHLAPVVFRGDFEGGTTDGWFFGEEKLR